MNPCQPLPAGWCAFTDEQSQRTYYAHIPSGSVRWSPPPDPPPPPPPPPTDIAAHQIQPNNSGLMNVPMTPHPPYLFNRNCIPPPPSIYHQTPAIISHYPQPAPITNSSHQHNQPHFNHMTQQLQPLPMLSMNTNFQPRGLKRTPEQTQRFPLHRHEKISRVNGPPSKRACFGIPNDQRGTTENGKDTRVKRCSACKKLCEWDQFSKRQWTLKDDVRKCTLCVKEMNAKDGIPPSGTSADLTIEKVGSDLSSNDSRVKMCSICKKVCRWADFTKQEWLSMDTVRKCSSCLQQIKEKDFAATLLTMEKGDSQSLFTAERKQTKTCSMCKKLCDWADFSKRQWMSKDNIRKCNQCMEKMAKKKHERQTNNGVSPAVAVSSDSTTEPIGQPVSNNHIKIEHISSSPVVSMRPSLEPRGILRNASSQSSHDDTQENQARGYDTKKWCSSCIKQFDKSQYSRRQWEYGDSKRRCNQCIEMTSMKKNDCTSLSSTTSDVSKLEIVEVDSAAPLSTVDRAIADQVIVSRGFDC